MSVKIKLGIIKPSNKFKFGYQQKVDEEWPDEWTEITGPTDELEITDDRNNDVRIRLYKGEGDNKVLKPFTINKFDYVHLKATWDEKESAWELAWREDSSEVISLVLDEDYKIVKILLKKLPPCKNSNGDTINDATFKYKYNQESSTGTEWPTIPDEGIELTLKDDKKSIVKIRANDGKSVFCINRLTRKYLRAAWIAKEDINKEWVIRYRRYRYELDPIELFLRDGYKKKVTITYEMDLKSRTHILCKKEQGKSMYALGPIDIDEGDPRQDTSEWKEATFYVNESEIIYCVGVKGSEMVDSNIFIKDEDSAGAVFRIKRTGEAKLIWEVILLEANDRLCGVPIYADPKTNVTMGEDEPGGTKEEKLDNENTLIIKKLFSDKRFLSDLKKIINDKRK